MAPRFSLINLFIEIELSNFLLSPHLPRYIGMKSIVICVSKKENYCYFTCLHYNL